jgi:hypothetical protein
VNILLFDIDGVLVDDRGYRAGLGLTIDYFSEMMGQPKRAPAPEIIELFHANSFTNEWDICAFAVGALIVATVRVRPEIELSTAPLIEFLPQLSGIDPGAFDYTEWVIATDARAGSPSERARTVLDDVLGQLALSESTRAAVTGALDELLADPYDVARSIVTQVFQEHILGSSLFEEVYRLRPRFEAMSLLYHDDRSFLNAEARALVRELVAEGSLRASIYSARPSLPPSSTLDWLEQSTHSPQGYSPEAELALQLIELTEWPLIAMGRMQWFASRVGTRVEYLVKPSPVQALAAILAALSRHEADAVESAYRLMSEGQSPSMLSALDDRTLDIWVVEDSVIGVHAASAAIDLINKGEIRARLHALGASAGGPKADALSPLCEKIVPDVNQAITYIAERVRAAQPAK